MYELCKAYQIAVSYRQTHDLRVTVILYLKSIVKVLKLFLTYRVRLWLGIPPLCPQSLWRCSRIGPCGPDPAVQSPAQSYQRPCPANPVHRKRWIKTLQRFNGTVSSDFAFLKVGYDWVERYEPRSQLYPRSFELTRGPPELVQHFGL